MQPSIGSNRGTHHILSRWSTSTVLSWCWILLCGILSVLAFLAVGRAPGTFDADVGSEAVLAKTLIDSGDFLVTPNFQYSTEVQVIGHHLLLQIGILLFPHNWMLARVFTLVIIMCALVASVRYCAISLDIWEQSRWIAGILLIPFSIAYRNYFLYGMYYAIALCLNFVVFGICIRRKETRAPRIVMLILPVVLGFICGVSGFRKLLLCCLPLFFAFAIQCIADSSGSTLKERLVHFPQSCKSSLGLSGLVVASSVVGFLVNMCMIRPVVRSAHWGSVGLDPIFPSQIIDFTTAGFIQTWGSVEAEKMASTIGIASLCGIISSLIVLMAIIICIRHWTSLTSVQRSYTLFMSIAFLMSVAMYYLGGEQRPRYLTSVTIPFILLVPIAMSLVQWIQPLQTLPALCLSFLLFFQATGYAFWPAIKHVRSGEPYDEEKVVTWLLDNDYTSGYACFWNCNNMVEISNGTLDIWCLLDSNQPKTGKWWSLKLNKWMVEKRHLKEDPEGEVFLLLTKDERDQAKSAGIDMGKPAASIEGYCIYTYDSTDELRDALGVSG